MRILVVEDNVDIAEVISQALADHRHEVVAVSNGRAALAAIDQRAPDLVILDLYMPVMDGWTFVRACRERAAQAPIIVLSAGRDTAEEQRRIGAEAYLAKPFNVRDLLELVQRFVPSA